MNGAQNLDIIFDPKSTENGLLRSRTWAFMLDVAAIVFINKGILIAYTNFLQTFFYQLPLHSQKNIINQIPNASFYTIVIVFFSYFSLSYFLGEGKTPGKLFMGLRVYSPSTMLNHLTFKESALRTIGYMTCYAMGLILFLAPFLRQDRKGLPDIMSGTETISEERFTLLKSLEAKKAAEEDNDDDQDQLSLFEEAA